MKKLIAFFVFAAWITASAGLAFAEPAKQASVEQISEKFDKLLKSQEEILKQLADIKNELYIVKIRATKR